MATSENVKEIFQPEVNQAAEMYEITSNFGNPLELLREAISNAYDGKATQLHISCYLNNDNKLIVKFRDNGEGMTKESLIKNFWGLGYTDKEKGSPETIGEKSHGTLIYLRSEKIIVDTYHETGVYRSEAENPLQNLENGELFDFTVEKLSNATNKRGTEITLIGFNQNVADNFKHDVMRDYLYWFTKLGSFQNELKEYGHAAKEFTVYLRGLDNEGTPQQSFLEGNYETCDFGHIFPPVTTDYKGLLKEKGRNFYKHYVKKWTGKNSVQIIDENSNVREVVYHYVIYYEGDAIKRNYNHALRPTGKSNQRTLYRVADRYGIYLAKDFIPIEKVNDWLPRIGDGSFTHTTALHGFINCQEIPLTSDRSSMASTQPKLADELRKSIFNLVKGIGKELKEDKNGVFYMKSHIEELLRDLGEEKPGTPPIIKPPVEPKPNRGGEVIKPKPTNLPNPPVNNPKPFVPNFDKDMYEQRLKKIRGKRYFEVKGQSQIELNGSDGYKTAYHRKIYEPSNEAETYGVFMEMYALMPNLFPFTVLDYSSHKGIDLLVSFDDDIANPSLTERIFYLELKHTFLGKTFNHAFHSLAYIVCWDIDGKVLPDTKITNNKGEEATYRMEKTDEGISYYLMQKNNPVTIQVIPLKRIIEEKLGLTFKR
ncbi:ATP-binding protein [Halobacillus sp. Cin3]|uniref:ATP-binding protein n=1 Tax=Halobacillus sp. Cin3 TaxID=2928441 RepID=UPI00248E993D|nr:ATP-binding protein [Halobacillus sp. Cin3]